MPTLKFKKLSTINIPSFLLFLDTNLDFAAYVLPSERNDLSIRGGKPTWTRDAYHDHEAERYVSRFITEIHLHALRQKKNI